MTGDGVHLAGHPISLSHLKRRLYGLAFVDEFGPVYAVYTLWLNDNGISTSQLSTVFVVWAIVALALEVPSGALADRVDRRRLLAAAFAIRATGLGLWLLWPTFTGVVIGTALWALHDSLASGTWEAMIHDELTAIGHGAAYAPVMARIAQFSHLGVATSTLLGAALLRLDVSLEALGWITLATHVGSTALVLTLPEVRRPRVGDAPAATTQGERSIGAGPVAETILADAVAEDTSSYRQWWATLRRGLRDTAADPVVTRLVAVGAMLEGLFIVDEYVPLLVRARDGSDAAAAVIVFAVWAGLLAGGEVVARRPDLSGRQLGGALLIGVATMAVAFASSALWALVLVGIGYAALEATWISADARLQERTPDETRATVTSVRGLGSAAISMIAFVVIGALADGDDPTPGLFVVLAALAVAGLLVVRWLPRPAEMEP